MKKYVSIFMICAMLFALCACGDSSDETTQVSEESADVATQATEITEPAVTTDEYEEFRTLEPVTYAEATLPILENYTFAAGDTANGNGFVFEGDKAQTLTCNKIVMNNKDGVTEFAISFADDGSALTVYTLAPDKTEYSVRAEFDNRGRLIGIYNGSGSYSTYSYADDTCLLQAFDKDDVLQDSRMYYYNAAGEPERIERGDSLGVYERYYYSYNAAGMTETQRVENESGYVQYKYTYDANNNLSSVLIEQNDSYYGTQDYTYDEYGNKLTYTYSNHQYDAIGYKVVVNYENEYAEDGTYLGTSEVDAVTGEVYISVAYDYVMTDYPHYADFIQSHYATY